MKPRLLIILTALLMLFRISASAEDILEFDYIPEGRLLQEGGFIDAQTRADALVEMSVSSSVYESIYNHIYESLCDADTLIYFDGYSIYTDSGSYSNALNIDEFATLFYNVVNDHPELYYTRTIFGVGQGWNNRLVYIRPYYLELEDGHEQIFDEALGYALSRIYEPGMTARDIALSAHDYLTELAHYTYDEDMVDGDYPEVSYTAYGALVNGDCVCHGYSLAYKLILNTLGINCYVVAAPSMGHAWNVVELDGEWYHVDLTYDDPGNVTLTYHPYFLLSDATMSEDHYGWDTSYYPECTDKVYESGYAFNHYAGAFIYRDGCFWFNPQKLTKNSDGSYTITPYPYYYRWKWHEITTSNYGLVQISKSDYKPNYTDDCVLYNVVENNLAIDRISSSVSGGTVYLAGYDTDGRLVDVGAYEVEFTEDGKERVLVDDISGEEFKVIFTDSQMTPLAESREY